MSSFLTINDSAEEILYKIKGSKFIGYAFPIDSEEDAKTKLRNVKQKHKSAHHCCYAFRLGFDEPYCKDYDDGEPKNSAGKPIMGQLMAFDLHNVMVVVVRYFGGTKLGVGGLIHAYKFTSEITLNNCTITTKPLFIKIQLTFEYCEMNLVMRLLKKYGLKIQSKVIETVCRITILVEKNKFETIQTELTQFHKIKWKKLND